MKDLWRLLTLFRPYWRWLLGGILLSTIVMLANVALLALAGWFITAMALAGLGLGSINFFTPAAAIRGLAIVRSLGRYGERLLTHEATLRLISHLRYWFYVRLEPLAPARLQGYRGGDLLSRMRADIDTLENFYLQVVVPCVAALLCVLVMLVFMVGLSLPVALINATGLLLAGVLLPLLTQRLGRAAGEQAVSKRAALRANLVDSVRGMTELHVYQALSRQARQLQELGRAVVSAQRRRARIDAIAAAVSALITRLSLWLALIAVIPLVASHLLNGADLALIAFFVLASFEAVTALPAAFSLLGESQAAARRLFELVDAAPAVRDPSTDATAPARFDVCFQSVSMRYDASTPWVLNDLNLQVAAGESIGIVGATGAGKTSLFNILLRFWDYQQGEVLIGGQSLRDFRGQTLRQWCAVVSQQHHLFNASIADNLRIANASADSARLWEMLERVSLADEVRAMPDGLDTLLGETGTRLSGGQARRLVIARAFLKEAPILLLDEPTEGLDAATEQQVLKALQQLMRDRTTLLISHRPQALAYVDRVVTLRDAQIEPWASPQPS